MTVLGARVGQAGHQVPRWTGSVVVLGKENDDQAEGIARDDLEDPL